jgi:hypothetical protein
MLRPTLAAILATDSPLGDDAVLLPTAEEVRALLDREFAKPIPAYAPPAIPHVTPPR